MLLSSERSPMKKTRCAFAGFSLALATIALACGSERSDFLDADAGRGSGADGGGGGLGQSFPDEVPDAGEDGAAPPPVPIVYAHSANTLYKVDPVTKDVTVVAAFNGGCSQVIDLALDQDSNAFVTTFGGLFRLDTGTATCTLIANGSYPNSLSFVPKGTVDDTAEALVGYNGATYVRIDTATGAVSTIGSLKGGYTSSGDIVSVTGGGTFLTVKGNACSDCLIQVDPKTGDMIQNYGNVKHDAVYGLGFWAGTVYGFSDAGKVFSIEWVNDELVTNDITVANPPSALSFYGAGSTTAAPAVSADGGGIPIIK